MIFFEEAGKGGGGGGLLALSVGVIFCNKFKWSIAVQLPTVMLAQTIHSNSVDRNLHFRICKVYTINRVLATTQP